MSKKRSTVKIKVSHSSGKGRWEALQPGAQSMNASSGSQVLKSGPTAGDGTLGRACLSV